MATKLAPWWNDPKLTSEQKQRRADALADVLVNAWLGLPRPTRRDLAIARSVARQTVARGVNPFPVKIG